MSLEEKQSDLSLLLQAEPVESPRINARGNPDWTQQEWDLVRQLWMEENWSAGKIAARLKVTRQTVIGRVHSKGWKKDLNAFNKAKIQSVKLPAKQQQKAKVLIARGDLDRYDLQFSIHPEHRKTFIDAASNACYWTYGEPGQYYRCCFPKTRGSNYCENHTVVRVRPDNKRD